uniref:amyloid-beta A4 precursor protein-binding family A member 2-like n=1 Tax=Callithrix jacchus TaxID=9483 RepID=UPI00159DACA5|nr:amyloid-beta A4 precursor protein-binding family A member 2-like [Callithrix jacchus]
MWCCPRRAVCPRPGSWLPCGQRTPCPRSRSATTTAPVGLQLQLVNNISEEEDYPRKRTSPTISTTSPRMTATWRAWTTTGRSTCPTVCTLWTPMSTRRLWRNGRRVDSVGLHPYSHRAEGSQDYPDKHLPILEDEPSVLEAHDQEEDGYYCHSKKGYQDCYPMEANGNTSASPYHLRYGEGDLEDQEKDINPIRSLRMTNITSVSEASMGLSRDLGTLPSKSSCSPSRHKMRPKSLNLPPEAKHHGDPQRGFKPKIRTLEERPK